MNARARLAMLVGLLALPGCAAPPAPRVARLPPSGTRAIVDQRREHAVVPGRTTKADVIAAYGKTLAVKFDSGFEVWVYRVADETASAQGNVGAGSEPATARAPGEFAILFSPSGVVAKTRIRPAP